MGNAKFSEPPIRPPGEALIENVLIRETRIAEQFERLSSVDLMKLDRPNLSRFGRGARNRPPRIASAKQMQMGLKRIDENEARFVQALSNRKLDPKEMNNLLPTTAATILKNFCLERGYERLHESDLWNVGRALRWRGDLFPAFGWADPVYNARCARLAILRLDRFLDTLRNRPELLVRHSGEPVPPSVRAAFLSEVPEIVTSRETTAINRSPERVGESGYGIGQMSNDGRWLCPKWIDGEWWTPDLHRVEWKVPDQAPRALEQLWMSRVVEARSTFMRFPIPSLNKTIRIPRNNILYDPTDLTMPSSVAVTGMLEASGFPLWSTKAFRNPNALGALNQGLLHELDRPVWVIEAEASMQLTDLAISIIFNAKLP